MTSMKPLKFDIASLKIDSQAEAEGIWVDAGGGLRLKIARLTSPSFEAWVRKHMKLGRGKSAMASLMPDQNLEAEILEGVARFILVDWANLQENGVDVPYSTERALVFLREYKEFYRMVLDFAGQYEGYRAADRKADEGN